MSRPFDSATKELLERDPQAWLHLLLGRKVRAARILNVDLSSVTAEADAVLAVDKPDPWLVHVEFQAGHDPMLPLRILRYNVLVHYRHGLPVQSVVVLLRPQANGPDLSGSLRNHLPDGRLYHEFRYNVVRMWDVPVDQVLASGLATLPLAPITRLGPVGLPELLGRMKQRIAVEADDEQAATLWATTLLLMGLVFPADYARGLLQGVRNMKESTTYQAILEEGRANEARNILKRLATRRLGTPERDILAAIDQITDPERLEQMIDRYSQVASWAELLASDGSAS